MVAVSNSEAMCIRHWNRLGPSQQRRFKKRQEVLSVIQERDKWCAKLLRQLAQQDVEILRQERRGRPRRAWFPGPVRTLTEST